MAHGSSLLFLNSDIEFIQGASSIDALVSLLEDPEKHAGVVGPKLLFPTGIIQSVGGLYDIGKGPYHRWLGWQGNYPPAAISSIVKWITGAFFLTPTALFNSLGGLDEGYKGGYFEDVDYCERVKRTGRNIWYCAEASFIHLTGQSMAAIAKDSVTQMQKAFQFKQNSIRFHQRWDPFITPDINAKLVPY